MDISTSKYQYVQRMLLTSGVLCFISASKFGPRYFHLRSLGLHPTYKSALPSSKSWDKILYDATVKVSKL